MVAPAQRVFGGVTVKNVFRETDEDASSLAPARPGIFSATSVGHMPESEKSSSEKLGLSFGQSRSSPMSVFL